MITAVSVILALFLGYHWRELNERLKLVEDFVKLRVIQKKKTEEENKSILLDPDDVAAQAQREHERIMKGLNPDE